MAGVIAGNVIEKLLSDQLEKALKEYVRIPETQKLNIRGGDLNLNKLTLLPRDLPGGFRVKGGFIQRLVVTVPWKALKKKSVEVAIDEVLVVVCPRPVSRQTSKKHTCTQHVWSSRAGRVPVGFLRSSRQLAAHATRGLRLLPAAALRRFEASHCHLLRGNSS